MSTLMNKQTATRLTRRMRQSLETFERDILAFVDGQGWRVLGYRTLAQWWDKELGEVQLGAALKVIVLRAMEDDRRLTFGERVSRSDRDRGEYTPESMGRMVGVRGTPSTVKKSVQSLMRTGRAGRWPRFAGCGMEISDHEQLSALAKSQGLPVAEVMRRAVKIYVATHRVTRVAA